MINQVVLVGRLTKDIELKKTNSNLSVAQFSLAVDRGIKKEDGTRECDFPNVVVWRQSADFLSQYARKGDLISVVGKIQTRTYDGQNGKVFITEVVANEVRILAHVQPKQEGLGTVKPEEIAKQNEEFKDNGELKMDQLEVPWY